MAWQRLAPMHMLISAHRDGRIIADAVDLFRRPVDRRLDPARRLGGAAHDAEAARSRRLRRHHAGRAARPGDGRERRHRQSRPPGRRADRADRLRHQPPACAATAGTASISPCRSAAASLSGASRSRSPPISTPPGSKQARLLVETRMNEMAREADRRVGHATAVRTPLSSARRRRDEPAEGDPRPSSRSAPDRSLACGEQRAADRGEAAVLNSALWPSLYRAATAAAAPLVRCYLRARAGAARKTASGLPSASGSPARRGRAGSWSGCMPPASARPHRCWR